MHQVMYFPGLHRQVQSLCTRSLLSKLQAELGLDIVFELPL